MSSGTTRLHFPVVTSPFAALLAGYGAAGLLADLGEQITGEYVDVRIASSGAGSTISADVAIGPGQVTVGNYRSPAPPWILTAKNGPPPSGSPIIDYEAERRHNSDYYEEIKRLQKAGGRIGQLPEKEREALDERAPRPSWPVAAVVNQLSAIGAYNKAVERWAACRDVYPELVAIIWTMCSGRPYALEQAQREWMALASKHRSLEKSLALSATQVVNPEQGKGANRPKADALTIGGREGFWLLEYFKFAGLYEAALPRTVQGKKDRKTYVVAPTGEGISRRWHQDIFKQFQREFWASSAIKMDIMAALRYTATMLTEWEGAQLSGGRRRRAADYVEGFTVASYKDLGSAVAVMNVATVGLPAWVRWPEHPEEAQRLRVTIDGHQRLIGALDEGKGEEEQLLRDYRDFLSSRDPALTAFFDFTTGYAGHILRKMTKGQRVRRLMTDDLEVIVMAHEDQRSRKLQPILSNPGFRDIATAIRQCTVTQQYHKAEHGDNTYEIRYGLANDLHRASRDNGEFMRVLGKFLQEYSQENARVMERHKERKQEYRRRIPISTEDIAQVAGLVDDNGAPTVASLLIAFGYALDRRAQDDGASTAPTDQPEITSAQPAGDESGAAGPF